MYELLAVFGESTVAAECVARVLEDRDPEYLLEHTPWDLLRGIPLGEIGATYKVPLAVVKACKRGVQFAAAFETPPIKQALGKSPDWLVAKAYRVPVDQVMDLRKSAGIEAFTMPPRRMIRYTETERRNHVLACFPHVKRDLDAHTGVIG
jgi:hypothetical protein